MATNKYLDYTGLQQYDTKIKELITSSDSETLQNAKSYADGLGSNYDPAGTAQTKVQELASGQVATNTAAIATLNGSNITAGSVAKQVKDAKDEVQEQIGTLSELDTTLKSDLVTAINEVRQSVEVGGTGSVVTIDTGTTTEGMSKTYTFKQGSSTIGKIDIPKDMVVSSGIVKKDPEDQDPGTYLVLTLANATSDKVYINVGTLVDIYTTQASATQVQLSINTGTREISASIVAGSVTATELASNAVTTIKIANGNVTKEKLETSVQTSLGKADTALQKADIKTGTTNGTISVDGTSVSVKGLGTAAYQNTTAFGSASAVSQNTNDITNLKGRVSTLEAADTYVAITEEEITALFSVA